MWFIIILTIISIILIHWLYNEFFGYWKKRGVPHPRTLPLFGNLEPGITLMVLSNNLNEAYSKYKDCLYVGFYQFQTPVIIIRDTELIKTITSKEFSSFHDNQFFVNEQSDPIFGKNPFVLKGEKWKISRTHIISGINNDKIKSVFNLMLIVNKNLIKFLNEEIKNKKPIDGKALSVRYTTDLAALCLFGFEGNTLKDPNSEFRQMVKKIFESTFLSKLKYLILLGTPNLAYILKLNVASKKTNKTFVSFFQKLIKHRQMNNIHKNDYLDHVISLKAKLGENEFTDEDVYSQIMTVMVGAIETSSMSLSFVLYELGKHFEIQTKLQEEIDNVMKKCNGEITYEELHNMNYLDMVLSESFRKYPSGMSLNRICTKQFTLPPPKGEGTGHNVVLETGTAIIIPNYAIHNDPSYYPEPEKFIPERFSVKAKRLRPKYSFLPFGDGPRMCLASRLAETEIKLAVISILANFNVKLNSKTESIFKFDMPNIFLNKEGGIWLSFDPRKN